ncbi:MAG: hypothetical protein Tsb0034_27770 [Ekhidna sp.]
MTHHLVDSPSLLEERVISVALPENYVNSDTEHPVLYVLDGETVFDYSVGAAAFLSNEYGYLPEVIVVSIPNTDRAKDFYAPLAAPAYDRFADFLEMDVFPLIDNNYRTNGFRVLYGWSSSSGANMHLMTKRPALIDAHILSGSGIGANDEKFITDNYDEGDFENVFLFANCEKGVRETGLNRFKDLMEELAPKTMTYSFEVIESTHVGVLAEGLFKGLNFVFGDYYLSDEVIDGGYSSIVSYYENLSSKYGYEVQIPLGAINETAGILIDNDQIEDAEKLLKLGVEEYPFSHLPHGALASLYKAQKMEQEAKKYFESALSKSTNDLPSYYRYKSLIKD